VGRWDQNGSSGNWLGGCGLDSTGSGQGPVAGCCECGDESSGSCATEIVSYNNNRSHEDKNSQLPKRRAYLAKLGNGSCPT
jgi:hypothetical protein